MNKVIRNVTVGFLLGVSILLVGSRHAVAQSSTIRTTFAQPATVAPRRVFVRSKSLLVRGAVVEEKLLQRKEFNQLGFVITREPAEADVILELRHDLLTKYIYSIIDAKTATVVSGGKVSSLGGTVAGKVAKKFVKEMARVRMP